MNKGDIKKLEQCWKEFIHSMKGAVLSDEILKFSIISRNDGYKIDISPEIALVISKLAPSQWMRKYMDHQDFIKEVRKMVKIKRDSISVGDECALFLAMTLYLKAVKKMKADLIESGKREIEEKIPEVISEKIYGIVKDYIKIYYSSGNFRTKFFTYKIKKGIPAPRLELELRSLRPKELIEEIRQLFKAMSLTTK